MLLKAADAFASTALKSRIPDFDVLLGPAYKGIPLAAVTVLQLQAKFNVDKDYCYNRKEKKDVRWSCGRAGQCADRLGRAYSTARAALLSEPR